MMGSRVQESIDFLITSVVVKKGVEQLIVAAGRKQDTMDHLVSVKNVVTYKLMPLSNSTIVLFK